MLVTVSAESSRPFRLFKELARQNCDSRGRKRKNGPTTTARFNWINPAIFQQIVAAAREVGPSMSPREIVNILHSRNPAQFSRLTAQVLGRWIERPRNGAARWKDKVLERVKLGNKPHGLVTRSGILVCPIHLPYSHCARS